METRKIQKVGGGTYTVSIPVDWAEEHGIQAGNTAYLYTHRDSSLVVRWNEKEHSELATTDIELDDSDPDAAERMLRAAYAAGFKRIRLRAPQGNLLTSEQRRAIDACIRRFAGFEIAEETDRSVTVRGLLDASNVSIHQSTVRLKHITLSMYEAALDLFAGEITEPERVITRDDEVDRIVRLITRHFNRSLLELAELDQLGISRAKLFEYYVTARRFDRIADHAVKIARCVQRTEYTVSEELLTESRAIGDDSRQVIEAASSALINGEATETAHSALDDCEHVIQEARRLDRTLIDRGPEEAYLLTRVLDSVIRTAEHGGNIAELALRASLRA
jgi:phosphate uptake regulator